MAFELKGPRRSVTIDTSDEVILFTLPQQFKLTTPICDRLWTSFYADPELRSVEEVAQFRVEIASIRALRRGDPSRRGARRHQRLMPSP
jgi:hypothetical protein